MWSSYGCVTAVNHYFTVWRRWSTEKNTAWISIVWRHVILTMQGFVIKLRREILDGFTRCKGRTLCHLFLANALYGKGVKVDPILDDLSSIGTIAFTRRSLRTKTSNWNFMLNCRSADKALGRYLSLNIKLLYSFGADEFINKTIVKPCLMFTVKKIYFTWKIFYIFFSQLLCVICEKNIYFGCISIYEVLFCLIIYIECHAQTIYLVPTLYFCHVFVWH